MKRLKSSSKSWNVLVYLAGDNNLSEEMVWSLQEMKKAASQPRVAEAVHVMTLFDPRGERERRYDIVTADGYPRSAADGELESLVAPTPRRRRKKPEPVRASVSRFLKLGIETLPRARHVAVVLSGHGSGALPDFLPDDDSDSAMSIPMMGSVLKKTAALAGAKIDVLGMDSCQMSTIEVGFEAHGAVQFLVGSESLVLNAGWPYHRVLEVLAASPISVKDAACALAEGYLAFYRDYELVGLSTDIAVTDLSRIEPVADAVRDLAEALKAPLAKLGTDGFEEGIELGTFDRTVSEPDDEVELARSVRDALVLAHRSAQSYKSDRYVDLRDLAEQLVRFGRGFQSDPRTEPIVAAARSVMSTIDDAVISAGTTGSEFQHSHGLSIYFPWSSRDYVPEYRNLRFHAHTRWADFLETYLRATVRMRRGQEAHVTSVRRGKGVARNRDGREVVALPPRRPPSISLGGWKDVDAGTHRDVDAGTHRGESCRSTMGSPPEGYYRPSDDSSSSR